MPYTYAEVRAARHEAHLVFDRFWKMAPFWVRRERRVKCYAWLAKQMDMPREECHIRFFDVGMCEAVIELCLQVEAGIIAGPNNAAPRRAAPMPRNTANRKMRRAWRSKA